MRRKPDISTPLVFRHQQQQKPNPTADVVRHSKPSSSIIALLSVGSSSHVLKDVSGDDAFISFFCLFLCFIKREHAVLLEAGDDFFYLLVLWFIFTQIVCFSWICWLFKKFFIIEFI